MGMCICVHIRAGPMHKEELHQTTDVSPHAGLTKVRLGLRVNMHLYSACTTWRVAS